MSVSIVRDGRLWGMISCHNTLPRFVSFEVRQACELIAQVLTWQIGVLEEAEVDPSQRAGARGRSTGCCTSLAARATCRPGWCAAARTCCR